MSLSGKRVEIAAALSTVDGVKGYAAKPSAATVGDGWSRWGGSERDELSGQFVHTWMAIVQLPADDKAAEAWIDAREDALWAALDPVGWIAGIEPVDIGASDGRPRIHGVMITMRSE
jgi:hypothetical protein